MRSWMNHDIAAEFISISMKISEDLNDLVKKAQHHCDDDELEEIRQAVGSVMYCLLGEIIEPLVERYPHLRPPQLSPRGK